MIRKLNGEKAEGRYLNLNFKVHNQLYPPSLIKWSLTTIVLRLKEFRYCSIAARGSLEILAYHSLPKY